MSNLKIIRLAADLTQQQLADQSGVSIRMIQKYETGDRDINNAQAITIYRLAKVLEHDMEDLLELKKEVEE